MLIELAELVPPLFPETAGVLYVGGPGVAPPPVRAEGGRFAEGWGPGWTRVGPTVPDGCRREHDSFGIRVGDWRARSVWRFGLRSLDALRSVDGPVRVGWEDGAGSVRAVGFRARVHLGEAEAVFALDDEEGAAYRVWQAG
jgi:hypothetical protein